MKFNIAAFYIIFLFIFSCSKPKNVEISSGDKEPIRGNTEQGSTPPPQATANSTVKDSGIQQEELDEHVKIDTGINPSNVESKPEGLEVINQERQEPKQKQKKQDEKDDSDVDIDDSVACLTDFERKTKIDDVSFLKYDNTVEGSGFEKIDEYYSLLSITDLGEELNASHKALISQNFFNFPIEKLDEEFELNSSDYITIKQMKDDAFKLNFKALPESIKNIQVFSIAPFITSRLTDMDSIRMPSPFLKYNLSSNKGFESSEIDIWPAKSLLVVIEKEADQLEDQYIFRVVKIN